MLPAGAESRTSRETERDENQRRATRHQREIVGELPILPGIVDPVENLDDPAYQSEPDYRGDLNGCGCLHGDKVIRIVKLNADSIPGRRALEERSQSNYSVPVQIFAAQNPTLILPVAPGRQWTQTSAGSTQGEFQSSALRRREKESITGKSRGKPAMVADRKNLHVTKEEHNRKNRQ